MKPFLLAVLLVASRVEAAPSVLVDKQFDIAQVSLSPDATTAFFVTGYDGGYHDAGVPRIDATLSSVSLAGGPRTILYTGEVQDVVCDATDVYFLNNERIWRMPRAGGKPTLLVNRANTRETVGPALNDESMLSLAIDDTNVYWAEWISGRIRAVPKQGGAITTLATGQIGIGGLAVDADHVYWTQTPQMRMGKEIKPKLAIQRVAKRGGTPESLVSEADAGEPAYYLRIDADSIYWLGGDAIKAANKDGSAIRTIVAERQWFAIDGDAIIVGGPTVRRIAKQGGAVTKLLDDPTALGVAAAGGAVVVWSHDPNVMATSPPRWAPKDSIRRLR